MEYGHGPVISLIWSYDGDGTVNGTGHDVYHGVCACRGL